MSNAVYPALPGLAWPTKRTPLWKTKVSTTPSGREFRTAPMLVPRYRYTLQYDFLRSSAALQEYQTLFGFFNARSGAFDTFLYRDPDDNTISGQPIGVGDGAIASFQLLRSLGGFSAPIFDPVLPVQIAWGATNQPANLLINSSFESQTGSYRPYGYGQYNNALVATTYLSVGGRTGGLAYALRADAATSSTFGVYSSASIVDTAPNTGGVRGGWVPGATYTISFYAKKLNGAFWSSMSIEWNIFPVSTVWSSIPTLNTSWQRYVVTIIWGATVEPNGSIFLTVDSSTATNDQLHIDDIQVVVGPVAPAYVSGNQAYAISSTGAVVFDVAPPAATALYWSGSYYWRCRFDTDELPFEQFMNKFWKTGEVKLITVKP